MKKIKKRDFFKSLILIFLSFLSFIGLFRASSINTYAHNAYFISITIDEGRLEYVPTVIFDENSFFASSHRENDVGDFTSKTVNNDGTVKDFTVPKITYFGDNAMSEDDIEKKYKEIIIDIGNANGLTFSFPGIHSNLKNLKRHANDKDEEIAYFISERLVASLNDTLGWMMNVSGTKEKITPEQFKQISVDLANSVNSVARGTLATNTVTLGSETFTIRKLNDSEKNLIEENDKVTINDYVYISSSSGQSNIALVKVNKGYQNREDISAEYKKALKEKKDPEYLNWQYIVLQGNYQADVKGVTYSNISEITKPNGFEWFIVGLIKSTTGGLRLLLGLYPLNEVFFNTGSRSFTYYYGVMPKGWMSSARLLNFVCLILAFTVVGFALVKLIAKKQLSTINVSERVSLLEGFKNIFVAVFSLASFYILFHSLIRLNYYLVNIFKASSAFSQYIGDSAYMNASTLGAALISVAFFSITAYYNIAYVLRAFTIAGLYGIAPLAIVSIAFGGKYKTTFTNYMNILIGNIFMQSIQVIAVSLFTSISATNSLKTFELLTILVAFIPFTNMIRQNIFGLSGGITDQASGILSAGKNLVGGVVSGAVGGIVGGKIATKGGSMGGNSGGSSSDGSIQSSANTPMSSSKIGKIKDAMNGTPQTKGNDTIESGSRNLGGRKAKMAAETGKVLFNAGAGFMDAGAIVGSAATGDFSGVMKASKNLRNSSQSLVNHCKNIRSAFKNPELKEAGVKELYQGKENSTAIMDDNNGMFNDDELSMTDYNVNFKNMRDAFLGEGDFKSGGSREADRDNLIAFYKSKGINDIKKMDNKTVVNFSNKLYNNRNFNLKDILNLEEN